MKSKVKKWISQTFQERSIVFVSNKITAFVNFFVGRRMLNVSWKNGFLIGLKNYDCQFMVKFDQKILTGHM